MEGFGLVTIIAFSILLLAIFSSSCGWNKSKEGYINFTIPQIGPKKQSLPTEKEPKGYVDTAELPGAPVVGLAEANSLPFQDPALVKATLQQLNELKQDMDGFASFEQPHLESQSDPAVKLPLTRFRGDYQRIQDEVRVLQRNPGIQGSLNLDDVFDMAANLRFLQRTYRLYAANQMVPATDQQLTKVGMTIQKEGFEDTPVESKPISVDELKNLSQKIVVEITRLSASGTTDPVLQARIGILTNMRQTIDDLLAKITRGELLPTQIPIMKEDYDKFLPALGSTSSGISGLISSIGGKSLSSLFNSYDAGDISGSSLAAALFERYADDLMKGLSFSVRYTSPNEADVAKTLYSSIATQHPGTMKGARGMFEETTRALDLQGFEDTANATGKRPPSQVPTQVGSFDWKKRVDDIQQNMIRAGLKPADFGSLKSGEQVSENFSWRGHAKMICSRLATHADPATPEQMGCPPVSWKGWRM